MPYVLVPVPAEHEAEFGQWLMSMTLRAALSAWPEGAVDQVLAQADKPARAMLGHLARAPELMLDIRTVAAATTTPVETLLGCVNEVNQYCESRSWPALVMLRTEQPTGTDSEARISLMMAGSVRPEVVSALEA